MLLFVFMISLLLSLLLTPVVMRLSKRLGIIDKPDARKVHANPIPRAGGVAIVTSFILVFFLVHLFLHKFDFEYVAIAIASLGVAILGFFDDKYNLSPKIKLAGQVAATSFVIAFGVSIEFIDLPLIAGGIDTGFLSIPLTFLWIILVTNAVNLIDGLDGLAAGVSSISAGTILIIASFMGNFHIIVICLVIIAACLGFLFYNYHPAKIFMGDTGSLFLGFILATTSVAGFKQATAVSLAVPLMIFAIPLFDTFFAVLRRKLMGKPAMLPDKAHLHHRLLALGLGHKFTVETIYLLSAFFGLLSILLFKASPMQIMIAVFVVALLAQFYGEKIGLLNRRHRPIHRTIYKIRKKFVH